MQNGEGMQNLESQNVGVLPLFLNFVKIGTSFSKFETRLISSVLILVRRTFWDLKLFRQNAFKSAILIMMERIFLFI